MQRQHTVATQGGIGMWRLWWVAWLVALLGCGGTQAPAQTPSVEAPSDNEAAPARVEPAPAQRSFLWQVSSQTAKVYLLGSVHVAKPDLYPLSPAIEQAYENSDALVLEVYLTKQAQAEVAAKSVQLGLYPEGDSVERHLSPAAWTRYSEYLQERGKPLQVFQRMRPWFASLALMLDALGQSGYTGEQGIDRYFQDKAEQQKKPIESLETVDEQMDALAGIADDTQELMLIEFIESEAQLGEQMDAAFQAWSRGDGEAMQAILLSSMMTPEYEPLYQKLFVERNRRMALKCREYLAGNGTHFVVVGSGHLVGDTGIVSLLRQAKFQVQQL